MSTPRVMIPFFPFSIPSLLQPSIELALVGTPLYIMSLYW